jgi:hypothetical protein
METNPKRADKFLAVESSGQALGLGWRATLEPGARGATVRLSHPEQEPVEIEITISARGPVIRASAAALEIDSSGAVDLRCERLNVDAGQGITLRAPEILQQATGKLRAEGSVVEVDAIAGDVRIHANDDVKVVGEQVLLNCDRDESPPSWLPRTPLAETTLPREDLTGDAAVFDAPAGR